jgi:hypothetical protein
MRRKHIAFMIIVPFFAGCTSDDVQNSDKELTCGFVNPTADLMWLKAEIASLEATKSVVYPYIYLVHGELNGETVFVFENCCPFCDSAPIVYNCHGEPVQFQSGQTLQKVKVIWRPDGFQCLI